MKVSTAGSGRANPDEGARSTEIQSQNRKGTPVNRKYTSSADAERTIYKYQVEETEEEKSESTLSGGGGVTGETSGGGWARLEDTRLYAY